MKKVFKTRQMALVSKQIGHCFVVRSSSSGVCGGKKKITVYPYIVMKDEEVEEGRAFLQW